jgi:hypothetical protein
MVFSGGGVDESMLGCERQPLTNGANHSVTLREWRVSGAQCRHRAARGLAARGLDGAQADALET